VTLADVPCPEESTEKPGSPGLVENDEFIVRVLFDPEDFKEGVLEPGVLGVKRLKKSEFSVARPKFTSLATVVQEVVSVRESGKSSLKAAGAVKAPCSAIRRLMAVDAAKRVFCVFDDPQPSFSGHALIGFSEMTRKDNYWAKKDNSAAAALGNLCLEFEKAGVPLRLEDCFT
jgi:hypothetical protein